jgi:hypothetical protein
MLKQPVDPLLLGYASSSSVYGSVRISPQQSSSRRLARILGFHKIHAGDRRQVDFGGGLHLSEGTPYRAGRNSHHTLLLTKAAAVSTSDAGLLNNFYERN